MSDQVPVNEVLSAIAGLVATLLGLLLAGVIFWVQGLVKPPQVMVKRWELRFFLAYFILGVLFFGGWLIWNSVGTMRSTVSPGDLDRDVALFGIWLFLTLIAGAYVVIRPVTINR